MRHRHRARSALAVLAALVALASGPASSAGVRHITVVNLMKVSAAVELKQTTQVPVARWTIEPSREVVFDIPPGKVTLFVTSSPCNGKHLEIPVGSKDRAVISSGCYLDIQ